MNKCTPPLLSNPRCVGLMPDAGPYMHSYQVAQLLQVPHEYILRWSLEILPASMRDMIMPAENPQYLLIHVDLFLTINYESSGTLH